MQDKVVLDFDGTLVVENSSRVLEQVVSSHVNGAWRRAIRWLFFGSGRRVVNAWCLTARRVTGRDIDWRFRLFSRLAANHTELTTNEAAWETAKRLTLNTLLYDSLSPVSELLVLSCGMTPVIEAFCSNLDRRFTVVAASDFSLERGVHRPRVLLEPKDKISLLDELGDFSYVTDDGDEAGLIAETNRTAGRLVTVAAWGSLLVVTVGGADATGE